MPLNPTTNTPIPDNPARFLFLAPIAKYLDEIFPDPEVSIWSPNIPDINRTGPDRTGPDQCQSRFMFKFVAS